MQASRKFWAFSRRTKRLSLAVSLRRVTFGFSHLSVQHRRFNRSGVLLPCFLVLALYLMDFLILLACYLAFISCIDGSNGYQSKLPFQRTNIKTSSQLLVLSFSVLCAGDSGSLYRWASHWASRLGFSPSASHRWASHWWAEILESQRMAGMALEDGEEGKSKGWGDLVVLMVHVISSSSSPV